MHDYSSISYHAALSLISSLIMAFPKLPLVFIQLLLLVSFVIVFSNEVESLSLDPTQPPVKPSPLNPEPVKPAPLEPQPPTQVPVMPRPPIQVPVKPKPPSQPPVKPQPPIQAPVQPQPPRRAPVKPQPPTKPPGEVPVKPQPPSRAIPKRSLVAVEGVVYCKPCEFSGVDTLISATPLVGAIVKLQCNNTKIPLIQQAKTDKNGYFFMMAQNSITTYGAHKCKVTLGLSPKRTCTKPTNLHNGLQGALLWPKKEPSLSKPKVLPYQVFSVGPFAFEAPTQCAP